MIANHEKLHLILIFTNSNVLRPLIHANRHYNHPNCTESTVISTNGYKKFTLTLFSDQRNTYPILAFIKLC
ncbi:hypothetical protein SAMN05421640_0760 [Ekhidna lutea]|uniref:Uncharacterized protein n=1 Tax=Ekhidna lutea TaxID=447679 RepID=A0A239FNA2_EKHLU|nr:hypothetical protein SAMN05421640_0760 [Ekhidna lutea]